MMSVSETTHTLVLVQGDLHQGANHLPRDTV